MIYTVKSKINGTIITTSENASSEREAKAKVKHRYSEQKIENITVVK